MHVAYRPSLLFVINDKIGLGILLLYEAKEDCHQRLGHLPAIPILNDSCSHASNLTFLGLFLIKCHGIPNMN